MQCVAAPRPAPALPTLRCFYILNPTCGYDPSILLLRSLRALLRLVTLFRVCHCRLPVRSNDRISRTVALSLSGPYSWSHSKNKTDLGVWTACRCTETRNIFTRTQTDDNITVKITGSMTHARLYLPLLGPLTISSTASARNVRHAPCTDQFATERYVCDGRRFPST